MPVRLVECRTAASPSRLPGLDWSVNPYMGCSHACAYCYAQDVTRFEMAKPWGEIVQVKTNIVQILKKELKRTAKGVFGVGTVTDPYQVIEKEFELTRGCLVALKNAGAQVTILTKSDLVLRDVDILKGWKDVEVGISVACVNSSITNLVERGAPSPQRRLLTLKRLTEEGVKTYMMAAPIVRGLSDSEGDLQALVEQADLAGVRTIMWDKFNPKPLATSRLRDRLAETRFDTPRPHTSDEVVRIRSVLESECSRTRIELLDAF